MIVETNYPLYEIQDAMPWSRQNDFPLTTTTQYDTADSTTIVISVRSAGAVNLKLETRDVWGWEVYRALRERWEAVYSTALPTFTGSVNSGFWNTRRPTFYRDTRQNLVKAKNALEVIVALGWVDTNVLSVDVDVSSDLNANTGAVPVLAYTDMLIRASCPTNWGDYTPWRSLGGGTGALTRVETGSWSFAVAGTSTVDDACGYAHTVAHTAGQVVVWACTNSQIQEGFDSSDYGYKHFPALAGQLAVTYRDAATEIDHKFAGAGSNYTGWTIVNTNCTDLLNTYYSTWACSNGQQRGGWYVADGYYIKGAGLWMLDNLSVNRRLPQVYTRTNNPVAIDVYAHANKGFVGYVDLFSDLYSEGWESNKWRRVVQWAEQALEYRGGTNGVDAPAFPDPCDLGAFAVACPANTNWESRGFAVDALRFLLKWNFEFK